MAHRAAWLCADCKHQLGEVVRGALRVWAPSPLISLTTTAVTCPRCGAINVWSREVKTTPA